MNTRNARITGFLERMLPAPAVSQDCRAESVFACPFANEAELDEALESFRQKAQDELAEKIASLGILARQAEHENGIVPKAVALWRAFDEETERAVFPPDVVMANPLDWKKWPAIMKKPLEMKLDDFFLFSEFSSRLFHEPGHFTWEDSGLHYERLRKMLFSTRIPQNTCFITSARNIRFAIKEADGSAVSINEEKNGGKSMRIEYSVKPLKAELVKKFTFAEKTGGIAHD